LNWPAGLQLWLSRIAWQLNPDPMIHSLRWVRNERWLKSIVAGKLN
jgi:hypothetical protein